MKLQEYPHRRLNRLTGEWVLVSPHRMKRPWQGKVEKLADKEKVSYDSGCYLCPGNKRANNEMNPDYNETYVFDNDFSALLPNTPETEYNENDLLMAISEKGICRVVCFSPDHSLSLAEMELPAIENVVKTWVKEYTELGSREYINYVQIFENKGDIMGCSNPHPHGQIWAQESIPAEPMKELLHQRAYFEDNGRTMLSDYLANELSQKERIVLENNSFVVVVPFWAVWPFETMIISKRKVGSIAGFSDAELKDLADIIKRLTIKYDNLFEVSFPYSSGMHQAPTDGKEYPCWHWHFHFYPPLLRSATVKKFMVGYEMLANPQRDITPEASAARLRELSEIHYKQKK